MPTTVPVAVPGADYAVEIGPGLLPTVGERLRAVTDAKSVALISDESVARRYGAAVDISLARAGFGVTALTVAPGEASKSWAIVGELLEALAAAGLDRTTYVVALGGGVIGDLAGFTAATYLRGVGFAQVPTTLLAQVDSSVGGKTGVDLRAGKNLAGAFKQPSFVLADTSVLQTLPRQEWLSGLAEVVKSAALDSEEFFAWIEANLVELAEREPAVVEEAVARCVAFKASVVARDEKEEGPRECLNYGHTLGHALEKVLGYGVVTHGAAVAEGMRFAARMAMDVGAAERAFVKRLDAVLDGLGFESIGEGATGQQLMDAMRSDKKSRSGAVRFVLVDAPGVWSCVPIDDEVLAAHIEAWASSKEG